MADDVTLRECPLCRQTRESIGALCIVVSRHYKEPIYRVHCSSCGYDGPERLTREEAVAAHNTRIPDPRVAALEAELAEARAWNSTLADTADALRAELGGARKALAASGCGGIYDVFQDVTDAIEQMALYIIERDRHVTELEDELVRLRPLAESENNALDGVGVVGESGAGLWLDKDGIRLCGEKPRGDVGRAISARLQKLMDTAWANANARVAAHTPGRPITRTEALSISHATLESAEAERNASDDGAVPPENDTTRETFLSGMRLVRDADGNVSLCGPDGDHVIDVRGNLGLGLSAYQIASWVVNACYQASRTCATCRFCERLDGKWCCVAMSHELSFYVEPQSDYCSTWQANVERASDMPSVDDGSTNSDAAMWRVDHASAIRYIEALLAERDRWAPVMKAVTEYAEARFEYERCNDFDGNLLAIMDLAAERVFDTAMRAIMEPTALREENADG